MTPEQLLANIYFSSHDCDRRKRNTSDKLRTRYFIGFWCLDFVPISRAPTLFSRPLRYRNGNKLISTFGALTLVQPTIMGMLFVKIITCSLFMVPRLSFSSDVSSADDYGNAICEINNLFPISGAPTFVQLEVAWAKSLIKIVDSRKLRHKFLEPELRNSS